MEAIRAAFTCYSLFFLASAAAEQLILSNEEFPFPTLYSWAGIHLARNGSLPAEFEQCWRDSKLLQEAFSARKLWAMKMVDASARHVSGALWGSRFQAGHFDACLAAGESSPVGARYCLAELTVTVPPSSTSRVLARDNWLSPADLGPDDDAARVFNGEAQARYSHAPGEVLVAQCVPRSCSSAALQAALRAAFALESAPGTARAEHAGHARVQAKVVVQPSHCTPQEEERPAPSHVVWYSLCVLILLTVASPYCGWSWWDWRRHLRALVKPDPLLDGMDLSPLSGMRLISALFITGAHRAAIVVHGMLSNQALTTEALRSPLWMFGFHGNIFNLTFLFTSGILTVLFKTKHGFCRSVSMRFLRLMPMYLLAIVFVSTALPGLGSGPLWNYLVDRESRACTNRWLDNVLFINNYTPASEKDRPCLLHSWFLAVEMQLFLACLLLRPERREWRALLAALFLSLLPPFVNFYRHGWHALPPHSAVQMENLYDDPWFMTAYTPTEMRATPFIAGLLGGKLVQHWNKTRGSRRLSPFVTWLLIVVASVVLVGAVLSCMPLLSPDRRFSALEDAVYITLLPLVWCSALAALLMALVFGENTWVREFLSCQFLVSLSRLTYGLYLASYVFQIAVVAAQPSPTKISFLPLLYDAFADVAICLLISLVLYLLLEAPARAATKDLLDSPSAIKPVSQNLHSPTCIEESHKKQH